MTALEIIKSLGGVMDLGRQLGISFTTVSSWGRADFIPEWRRPKLFELAAQKNVPLSTADFPEQKRKAA